LKISNFGFWIEGFRTFTRDLLIVPPSGWGGLSSSNKTAYSDGETPLIYYVPRQSLRTSSSRTKL